MKPDDASEPGPDVLGTVEYEARRHEADAAEKAGQVMGILLREHRARTSFEALALMHANTIIELRARVAELEAENDDLRTCEHHEAVLRERPALVARLADATTLLKTRPARHCLVSYLLEWEAGVEAFLIRQPAAPKESP